MSIYLLRHGDLIKIGFSDNLAERVKSIMRGIPGDVVFVGHMPGGKEVEAHLHARFADQRFSGEWFMVSDDLWTFARIALDPTPPEVSSLDRALGSRRKDTEAKSATTKEALRRYAAARWPSDTEKRRIERLTEQLGWLPSRLKGFYHGDARAVLRASEAEQLSDLFGALDRTGTRGE